MAFPACTSFYGGKRKALYILPSRSQNGSRLKKRYANADSIEEGCGDSQDEKCSFQPSFQPSFPPFLEDASDSTEYLSDSFPSRSFVSSDYGIDADRSGCGNSTDSVDLSHSSTEYEESETHADPHFDDFQSVTSKMKFSDSNTHHSKLDYIQFDESLKIPLQGHSAFAFLENDRIELIRLLAQTTLAVNAGLTELYHAVCMFDTCIDVSRKCGKRIDSVQREILGLTCLFIVCQNHAIRNGVSFCISDEFCSLAGAAQRTAVKGCMVENQKLMIEKLLGYSSLDLSPRQLWRLVSDSQLKEIHYMSRFVVYLVRSELGKHFLSKIIVYSALHVLNHGCLIEEIPSRVAIKTLLVGLLLPLSSPENHPRDANCLGKDVITEENFRTEIMSNGERQ